MNVFFFVDSPYKRKAARRISRWLELRFLLEVVAMPVLVCWAVADADAWDDLEMQITNHRIILVSMVVCLMIYFSLWLFMQFQVIRQIDQIDIFTASERGDLLRVKQAMEQLVAEVREMTCSASAEIDLNKPDVDGNTLLMLAARQGHAEVGNKGRDGGWEVLPMTWGSWPMDIGEGVLFLLFGSGCHEAQPFRNHPLCDMLQSESDGF